MNEPTAAKPRVFISYSHKDERWKDQLLRHLRVAAREGDFEIWSDRDIQAGDAWYEKIVHALEGCSLALVLVSTDFLGSEFIRREEVPRLLKQREVRGMRIVPVILKACLWNRIDWLPAIQARPRDGEPLAKWRGNRLETELAKIAEEVWDLLKQASPAGRPSRSSQFLAAFRQRLAPAFSRWDLGTVGVTQTGGPGRPIEADLDEMYLSLRLADGFDISKTDLGDPITPQDLLARARPLAIRGAAGTGKTTWMRWTFRQLLQTESALPLMLVLRDLARKWQEPSCKGAARALDAFLEGWIAEHGVKVQEGALQELLASQDGPRPVLLVDGWDEIGPLGEELRQKLLGFLRQYPRVLAVVTSRPYGQGRPSNAEGFEVLDIQPLSDPEIADLARRFFTRCYGEEDVAVNRETERFQRALKRNAEPEALARTPLLLTMMLLISRSRPLPDKRHLLYEACIENLLTALPNRKEEEGALRLREQWRPDDSEERLRVAAAMAATLQGEGYETRSRFPIVQTWDQMAGLLPSELTERQRLGFLAWLAGPAGLLTDRADGTLTFAHLSFQEFLTAWHLNATIEGAEERTEGFRKRLSIPAWWETLRLWAALIQRQNRERLDPVLRDIAGEEEGLTFVGTVLADGLGSEERFQGWLDRFLGALARAWSSRAEFCTRAWSASRQDERKSEFARRLADSALAQHWLGWLRHRDFAQEASLPIKVPLPASVASSRALLDQLAGSPEKNEASIAFGRILCGGPPLWPIEPLRIGLLQVWPGDRRLMGLRFQTAQCSGADSGELTDLARALLKPVQWSEELREWARVLARSLAPDWARHWTRDLARHLARDWAHDWARYLARDLAYGLARRWAHDRAHDRARDWAHDLARDLAPARAPDRAFFLGIDPHKSWIKDFIASESFSHGRAVGRGTLAQTTNGAPESLLLAEACRISLESDRDASSLDRLLDQHSRNLDPLWPALARHLARRSSDKDRALLIDLAQHPEKREPPLSWGLRFIVRGDVMMDDGSVVTMDELADEVGHPHLPYLEDMPDDSEIPL